MEEIKKISKEDVEYILQIDDQLVTLAHHLVAVELSREDVLQKIRLFQSKKREFMTQIYEKHKIDPSRNVEFDIMTGEIKFLDNDPA